MGRTSTSLPGLVYLKFNEFHPNLNDQYILLDICTRHELLSRSFLKDVSPRHTGPDQ